MVKDVGGSVGKKNRGGGYLNYRVKTRGLPGEERGVTHKGTGRREWKTPRWKRGDFGC